MSLVILNQVELIMFEFLYPHLHRPIEDKSAEKRENKLSADHRGIRFTSERICDLVSRGSLRPRAALARFRDQQKIPKRRRLARPR